MVVQSSFRGVIEFFARLGLYDVVLPFLLTFTLVFAIMEKSKVLGVEKGSDGKESTRKNLNAMVAFVVAFLVVASSRLVAVINQTMSQMVLLLLLSICFLILIGSFMKETSEGVYLKKPWSTIFMIIMFVGIVLIFLNALGWLLPIWLWIIAHWDSNVFAAIVLFIVIVLFMYFIIGKEPSKKKSEASDTE